MAEQDKEGGVYLTKEEAEAVAETMSVDKQGMGNYPQAEEKHGIFQFLAEVFRTKDTSKGGNVVDEELFSVRARKEGALYFETMDAPIIAQYERDKAEITLATSLSKKGFLIQQAITQKKDLKVGSKEKKKSSFFPKKETTGGET